MLSYENLYNYGQIEGYQMSDIVIRGDESLNLYLFRSCSSGWYALVEEKEENANTGDRFLVRSRISNGIITDYITEKVEYETNYGKWVRYVVIYYEERGSPFSFHYDRFTDRDD